MGIIYDSHDRGKGHRSLVQRLDKVGEDHDGENALVDKPFQAFVGLFIDFDDGLARILSDLLVNELVVHVRILESLILDNLRDISYLVPLIVRHRSSWTVMVVLHTWDVEAGFDEQARRSLPQALSKFLFPPAFTHVTGTRQPPRYSAKFDGDNPFPAQCFASHMLRLLDCKFQLKSAKLREQDKLKCSLVKNRGNSTGGLVY